jgi:hydroxycarboxylate dehydrogenase B
MEIAPGSLEDYATAILVAAGSSEAEAREVAQHLVDANLKGHDSHGVGMLLTYVKNVQAGLLHPNRHARMVSEFGAIAVFDGEMGYGQVVAREATEWGIAKAKTDGLAATALRNAHHIARVGAYGELAAAQGLISLHFANVLHAPGRVAPFGGIEGRYGTDPVCITYPSLAGKPAIVLDFATSKIAAGKIRVAFNQGKELAPDTLIDKRGQESRDAALFYAGDRTEASILPFGEHKGSGLALVTHLLAGVLTGSGVMQGTMADVGIKNGLFSIYIDPARFGDTAEMERNRQTLIDWVKSATPRPGFGAVQIAGEPERASQAARSKNIPVDDNTWKTIQEAAKLAGLKERGNPPAAS